MPLSWIIPDGTNIQIEEAEAKTIANFTSPGGGRDAMISSWKLYTHTLTQVAS